jgi:adenosylmethionine-8-amino-7-oxononanoate aminotransferase
MAATLCRDSIYEQFLGKYEEFKTFFHGHSYTGNQLGSACAQANLSLLESHNSKVNRTRLFKDMSEALKQLWRFKNVGDIRQVGLVAGIELVDDWRSRKPIALAKQAGIRVCEEMAKAGVLTRPIGNVIVLMPPYCTTTDQLAKMVGVMSRSIKKVFASEQ